MAKNDPQDYDVQSYQDDLDNADSMSDPIMAEQTDDPIETLGVPADEFKREMDDLDIDDDTAVDNEDARERIEDMDKDLGEDKA
ncbi:MAG TPA: hypothetical protein VFM68_02185 [Candidatus Saccharimonadales bacterium]|nr:hypothetical protein [Candidatus Saccharimonadales bacterium]